ncbi:MAG: TIR domain-containing protein [Oscillospiraceae bacterium]|nr:TIR domain-containing protein [Oscillospiraceae bacterium]
MDLHYNAFISYRHHPEDIKVAETIHRSLERFRVPKALKKQGKKIERLFRDKEELPITSSLTDTITMALRNSDYQIVICSTHLKDSYWVQREIETFLQTHTKDKVLTVLVDGDNPYDVIPEILTYNEVVDPETGEVKREPIEPLSCDWRLPRRKAMKEELPRLAAVLLGCSYDELRQRQKQYRMRRLITGLAVGAAASLALAGYFLYSSIQIQNNLNESLRNQSQYLASASEERFDSGDRLTALALALEGLPNEENERPYVPAAERALTDALMLYEPEGQIISVASFNTESSVDDFAVTDDAHTIYVVDDRHTVNVWDTYEYKKLSTFNISSINSAMLTDNDGNLLFIGGETECALTCCTRDGEFLWQIADCGSIAFCKGKNVLLAIRKVRGADLWAPDTFELLQIDPKSGELLAEPFVMFDSNTMYSPYFTTDTYDEGQPVSLGGYVSGADERIVIVDPETQTCRIVLDYDGFLYASSVTEDGLLYILVSENSDVINGRLYNYYFYSQSGAWLHCYDLQSGKEKWDTYITTYNYSEANTITAIEGTDHLFCQYGSAFLQLDAKTGKILKECHASSVPLTLNVNKDSVWTLFSNGTAGSYTFETNSIGVIQYMENGLLMGCSNHGIYVVPQLSSSVLLYRSASDDRYEAFKGEYDDYINQLSAYGDYLATYNGTTIYLFDMSSRELVWNHEIDYSNSLLGFSPDSSTLYMRKYNTIKQFDVRTGELTEWELPYKELSNYTTYCDMIEYIDGTICCLIYSYDAPDPYIAFCDCDTKEYVMYPFLSAEELAVWEELDGTPSIVHAAETYVLIRTPSGNLYRFDRTTNEAAVILTDVSSQPVFLADAATGLLVFGTSDGVLVTDDLGNPVLSIPLTDVSPVSFCIHEEQLLFLGNDGIVYRYDMEGNQLSTTTLSLFSNFFTQTNYISSQRVPISWAFTPNGELILNAFRMGNIINTEYWERTCDVQQLVTYHEGSDSFICQSNDMIFAYDRCTLEEIMARAEEELSDFELTDEQKAYYGLN